MERATSRKRACLIPDCLKELKIKLNDGFHNGYCVKHAKLHAPALAAKWASKGKCSVLGCHSLSTFTHQNKRYCTPCCPDYDEKRAALEKQRLRKEEERRGERLG